jgi:hypothetical protein
MRSLITRIVLFALVAVMAAHAADPVVIPKVSFDNLSKDRVTLPADFHGDRNLLLLYFDLTQQPEIDDWNAIVDRWRAGDASLTSYTLLVSSQKNFLSRWWQNASMRSAVDSSHWPTTLPVYVDKRAFERKLGIASEKQVWLLLADRQGRVLSRVGGPSTDASRNAMRTALNAAGAHLVAVPAQQAAPPPQ